MVRGPIGWVGWALIDLAQTLGTEEEGEAQGWWVRGMLFSGRGDCFEMKKSSPFRLVSTDAGELLFEPFLLPPLPPKTWLFHGICPASLYLLNVLVRLPIAPI
jgi:hypothetical protein